MKKILGIEDVVGLTVTGAVLDNDESIAIHFGDGCLVLRGKDEYGVPCIDSGIDGLRNDELQILGIITEDERREMEKSDNAATEEILRAYRLEQYKALKAEFEP